MRTYINEMRRYPLRERTRLPPPLAAAELQVLSRLLILIDIVSSPPAGQELPMGTTLTDTARPVRSVFVALASAILLATCTFASAQTRLTGLDVSYYQGILSQANWNTIHNTDGRSFVFIRSSRGGTTGNYDPSVAANNTLSRRYDDPYFVQNITYATNAGMYAGPYHFGRMDITEDSPGADGANTGADEADHFIEAAGAWMRPGYLLPVFDFEAGAGIRTPSELAQFAIDFSDRIYEVKGIRPAVYIGGNYAQPMNAIPESPELVAAYPTLWTPRWPNQSNPNAIDIQNSGPGASSSTAFGPWDNPPNPSDPWHFWQYASTGRLQGIGDAKVAVDLDVAHGGIEFLKDHLVPALWVAHGSGDWSGLTNWNSGVAPTPPVTGENQPAPTLSALPTPRLPGADDTVLLDRADDNVTVTISSGTENIRKLYVHSPLNISGGALNVGYVPSADSTPFAAEFSDAVTLSGNGSLSIHSVVVDAQNTFTLTGGTLTFNKITLGPDHSNAAKILIGGNVAINPLANVTATIASSGIVTSGTLDLNGAARIFTVGNGSADIDLAINVPITNGGLTKTGPGTLALNGANTYTGDTVVQTGRLRLATPSLADTSSVYLSTGTTLDLNFTGSPDYVRALYLNGVAQANGIWGAIGSGAPFTSPYITGTGRLFVSTIAPPLPPPGDIIDSFEVNEGHFGWDYNNATQTTGLAAATTINRITTDHQGTGEASQLLNLVASGGGAWTLRHNSGTGTNLAAEPAGNTKFDATGYVGFWLKTDDPGLSVRIGIDDPVSGNTALERGFAQTLIADNQWHLYQWNLENAAHWDAYSGGANGQIDAPNGKVSIDSIWLTGIGDALVYLDNVSHNALGLLAASSVAGDYNGDGTINIADYQMWRSLQGNPVTAGTKADGSANGLIDAGDYVMWRKLLALAGGTSASAASIPEPAALLLAAMALALIPSRRTPLAV
jgi:autotransporter-associated beta strand protein